MICLLKALLNGSTAIDFRFSGLLEIPSQPRIRPRQKVRPPRDQRPAPEVELHEGRRIVDQGEVVQEVLGADLKVVLRGRRHIFKN